MAKSKPTTSRNKSTKSAVKRSAHIEADSPMTQIGGEGGWIAVPHSSPLGLGLIEQIGKAVSRYKLLDEHHSPIRTQRAAAAAVTFAEALAVVPPKGAIEALAAAILIYDDVDTIVNCGGPGVKESAAERIRQRAVALASWVENTHRVSRTDHGLDYFCDGARFGQLLPHTLSMINVSSEFDG